MTCHFKQKLNEIAQNDDLWEVINITVFIIPIVLGIFFGS